MKKIMFILLVSALSLLACPNNAHCEKKSCDKQSCPMEAKACPNKGEGKSHCPQKENCHIKNTQACACETKCVCEGKKECDCKEDCVCPKCKEKK